MKSWGLNQKVGDKIILLADGSAELTKKLGLDFDLTARGLGVRSKRYAMIIDDMKVSKLYIDDAKFTLSSAENILSAL